MYAALNYLYAAVGVLRAMVYYQVLMSYRKKKEYSLVGMGFGFRPFLFYPFFFFFTGDYEDKYAVVHTYRTHM